jgi:AcrR family transcriptional regulator
MIENKELWIQTGYEIFAVAGLSGLKIEVLAKKVGISKSSFYHHFADLELFLEHLLKYHLQQSKIIAEKEFKCQNIDPELIQILLDHKIDLLFNRQLRIYRNQKIFADTLNLSNQAVGSSFVLVWVKELNLKLNQKQLESIFELAIENFFLQITPDNLTQQWLSDYFTNLKRIAHNFS